jgi:hypothetical protein
VTEAQQYYEKGYKDGAKETEFHSTEDLEK